MLSYFSSQLGFAFTSVAVIFAGYAVLHSDWYQTQGLSRGLRAPDIPVWALRWAFLPPSVAAMTLGAVSVAGLTMSPFHDPETSPLGLQRLAFASGCCLVALAGLLALPAALYWGIHQSRVTMIGAQLGSDPTTFHLLQANPSLPYTHYLAALSLGVLVAVVVAIIYPAPLSVYSPGVLAGAGALAASLVASLSVKLIRL